MTPHEQHHIDDLNTVLSKFFKKSASIVLAGCNADPTANATAAEGNAKAQLSDFANKLRDSARDEINEALDRKAEQFHQSPQGKPADFFCNQCPNLLPDSKGWCTVRKKPQPEQCGFETATQACEKQWDEFIVDKVKIPFGGSEPTAVWYINHCLWDSIDGSGGFTAPTLVEYKCNSRKPTATDPPWSCPP